MSKEEIRAISLAKLDLYKAGTMLDIGAGTGSISIEAGLHYPNLEVTAIDSNEEAVSVLRDNRKKFGLKNIISLTGRAPVKLDKKFDAIFIGGSRGSLADILAWSFGLLKPKGKLVMNFILEENAQQAKDWLNDHGHSFSAALVQVSRQTPIGAGHCYKPQNPVVIIEAGKEE